MRKFLVNYKYIDKSLRERFGTLPINYDYVSTDEESVLGINDFIYSEVANHLLSMGINIFESNINIRPCFSIEYVYEF